MEKNNNINIAEILKDCPKGMKLYSLAYGKVKLSQIEDDGYSFPIIVETVKRNSRGFTKEGRIQTNYSDAECLLFPSSEMRDWSKFFKRGDVLCHKDGNLYVVFESWANDDYTEFNTTDISFGKVEVCNTDCFVKASDEQRAVFIAKAEKHYNGKYNPDTLQVEPVKPKCQFKPFDKVLVRDKEEDLWDINFFSHYKENEKYFPYACINTRYRFCIPYEGNEHLLGTTDPYTEGGSE